MSVVIWGMFVLPRAFLSLFIALAQARWLGAIKNKKLQNRLKYKARCRIENASIFHTTKKLYIFLVSNLDVEDKIAVSPPPPL
jgi:hypothetical protein